jgi:putative ABC transport system permease protein
VIRNFLVIAIRNLRRNKTFSTINIVGLAIGIATCLLILLFVGHELSFDRFNDKADQIVRVTLDAKMQGGVIKEAFVMPPVGPTLKMDFPEVQEATRIREYGTPRVSNGKEVFREGYIAFVDSNFFRVFTVPLLEGNAATALMQPNSIVITKAVALKYFGSQEVVGKTIVFKEENLSPMKVTGVIDEMPENSHFHFSFLASMSGLPEARNATWVDGSFHTYLLLPKGYDYKKLEAQLPREVDKYLAPQFQKALGMSLVEFRKGGNSINLLLQPLTDIHLHSENLAGGLEPGGDIRYVYIFGAVAVFMLLIACINFMNLSTAGASKRAREVGIRKVMGSMKGQLVVQFLAESILLTAVAMGLAVALVYLTLPLFNQLTGLQLHVQAGSMSWLIPALVGFGLFTGVLAGSYPAFYLSAFNPVRVLKGRLTAGKGGVRLRSGLVVLQFFISIGMIVGTVTVYRQLDYIRHERLGYDREQVVVVQEAWWLGKNLDAFKQELQNDPRVSSVSLSGFLPAGQTYGNTYTVNPDGNASQLVKTVRYEIDENYISTLGMQLAAGRNFSKAFGTDSSAVIVNETAAGIFGWGQNALGHTIAHLESDGSRKVYRVIGVVRDFHFRSFHELITPLVMEMGGDASNMIVRTKTGDYSGLLADMKNRWTASGAEAPFAYSFLDQRFKDSIKAEQNIGDILGVFAGLTIFVACLGLFGLATFTAEQRTKEIGIRKVLGADTATIVSLLSKDFLRLVAMAFLVAAPVAWLLMNRWLQDFAYRISIGWWIFALAAGLTLVITLLTISLRAVKAALANPVDSLRSE